MNEQLIGRSLTSDRKAAQHNQPHAWRLTFKEAGLSLPISAVVLRSLLDALPFSYQIAGLLYTKKIKSIHSIQKGNVLHLGLP